MARALTLCPTSAAGGGLLLSRLGPVEQGGKQRGGPVPRLSVPGLAVWRSAVSRKGAEGGSDSRESWKQGGQGQSPGRGRCCILKAESGLGELPDRFPLGLARGHTDAWEAVWAWGRGKTWLGAAP